MQLSIVLVSFNRAYLLERSLECYALQDLPKDQFELIVVDDDSTDGTQDMLARWSRHLNIVTIKVYKPEGVVWRDCAINFNLGIRAAKGEVITGTHPEVMVGRKTLSTMVDVAEPYRYTAAKIYYFTQEDQVNLDSVPWHEQSLLAVRQLPNFYGQTSPEIRGDQAYTHAATDRHINWESFVFGGMTRETWRHFGGFTETPTWGTIDVDFCDRRRILNIGTDTMLDPETFCVHQNHDAEYPGHVLTPRDMGACLANVPRYQTPDEARRNHLW